MFALSRKTLWVMLTIFAASCSFTIIQRLAVWVDVIDRPNFGIGALSATSGSVAWLLATRVMQAGALQIIAGMGLYALSRRQTFWFTPLILTVVLLMQLKAVSQLIQAWGLFHDVWHVRDIVNSVEVLIEAVLIALIVTSKSPQAPAPRT